VFRDSRVLEIGPGGGRYTKYLIDRAALTWAVDCSAEMLRRCAKRFGGSAAARFIKNNGHDLAEIPAASFDYACAFNVFVQLDVEDVFGYLLELRRVLAPGGICCIHYAEISGPEGWSYFQHNRCGWAVDPAQRGRFGVLTLATMKMLAERAGLEVTRNQAFGRDAVLVARCPSAKHTIPAGAEIGAPANATIPCDAGATQDSARAATNVTIAAGRDFLRVEEHLDDLAADVHHEPTTAHHTAAAHDAVESLLSGLEIRSAVELGCGPAPALDKLAQRGIQTMGVSLGDESCAHEVLRADVHFSGIGNNAFDLAVARHVLEHSPMPLLLLMEMYRISNRYALAVVPCDDQLWIDWPNHYSVLSKAMWRKLFRRARFEILREVDAPLEPHSTEWRFLLQKL
jgi:ubiquinone/menaquinone biosynthesis C-methylase UbiE